MNYVNQQHPRHGVHHPLEWKTQYQPTTTELPWLHLDNLFI
jgi:hypothetical protein